LLNVRSSSFSGSSASAASWQLTTCKQYEKRLRLAPQVARPDLPREVDVTGIQDPGG
jgi:hypothetical protein